MSRFCFVVEKAEWDEDEYELTPGSEVKEILRVFEDINDAMSYIENNSKANYPFDFRWSGDKKYSARSERTDSGWREGVAYNIHYVPLS